MKILLVQDLLRSGGTERQTLFLAKAFAKAGHAVRLMTFRPGGALAPSATGTDWQVLQPFDTTLDWFAPGIMPKAALFKPDRILVMGRMANCYGAGLAAAVPKARVYSTFRTGKELPFLYRRSLSATAGVIANSHDAARTLESKYAIPRERITVIHNSLLLPPRTAADPTVRESLGARADSFVMLSVAMFRPEKNQRELIEIVKDLPASLDWRLWLAGDGPEKRACEGAVKALHLTDRIRFLGLRKDPSPFYAAADLAVHASRSESLSNFLIEAQAQGLSYVACEAQGIAECGILGSTATVLAHGDREAFRAAILRHAAFAPPERASRSAAASAYARATFDPERQVEAYLKLFQSDPTP